MLEDHVNIEDAWETTRDLIKQFDIPKSFNDNKTQLTNVTMVIPTDGFPKLICEYVILKVED